LKHAQIKEAAEALFNEQRNPFGAFSLSSETHHAVTIPDAVRRCRTLVPPGGVVLLSPAAPSYGRYRNFEHRSEAFAAAIRESA